MNRVRSGKSFRRANAQPYEGTGPVPEIRNPGRTAVLVSPAAGDAHPAEGVRRLGNDPGELPDKRRQ
jgi:hypothetical protein